VSAYTRAQPDKPCCLLGYKNKYMLVWYMSTIRNLEVFENMNIEMNTSPTIGLPGAKALIPSWNI